jgi:7,8-dihydropterin-6-yl-methyl-4-(beta-D-ribofuranosyl)aminobenzene 5'-phosphate synthase
MHRRTFLKLGALASSAFFVGGVGRTGQAAVTAAQGMIPTVDQLVMTNVVDNVFDVFARGGQIGDLTVRRRGVTNPLGSGAQLLSEHGLAYHLMSQRGMEQREILLDFALTGASLINNYQALGIDPARADALILSHGHNDHYGALPGLVSLVPRWAERNVQLYAGGEDTFCHRWVVAPDGQRTDMGLLDRGLMEAHGLAVILSAQPAVVADHAMTSGRIPRVAAFESPPATARLEAGEAGSGCEPSLLNHFPAGTPEVEAQPGEMVRDYFEGEHATVYHIKDRGLVVISSCGHAGIVNTVRHVQAVTGIEKVHAIVGGWHLAPAPDDVVAATVNAFKDINPDYLMPMHCTGINTISAVQRELPGRLVMPSTGTRVVFGA